VNLLEIIQSACADLTLPEPAAVVGSTDATASQLLEIANKEGRDLARCYAWQTLIEEATFTTVATESQGALTTLAGTDFRYIVGDTIWNRTTGIPVCGPVVPSEWQAVLANSFTGPYPQWRIRGGTLRFLPVPTAGQTCAFEYVSKNWCTDSTGVTTRAAFASDQDLCLVDDELVLLGIQWRWRKAKGFEYSEEFLLYERQVADAMARDGGKRKLNLAGRDGDSSASYAINRVIGS
jgi:hypothetical protein